MDRKYLWTDQAGKPSSTRVIALWVYLLFGVCWCWASIKTGAVADVPDSVLFLLGIASGQQQGGKYFNETKPQPPVN